MIADYYVLRRRQLHLAALYREDGDYRYTNGFSLIAIMSLIVAVLPNLPGFLVTVKLLEPASVSSFLVRLYDYAWFVGFIIAFVVYLGLRYACDWRAELLRRRSAPELAPPKAT
jgi:nucleobase:cation symporter-1, NCS1 family